MVQNGSDYTSIESGVPQGSVIGPLLFLVYINDLERNIKSNIKFFADAFSIVENPEISANDLIHGLDVIHRRANQWKLEFNPDPIKQATEIFFSCETFNPNHPQLTFNEKIITAKRNLVIIKHLSIFLLPRKTFDQMYKALVRSHLDCCDIIYHIPSVQT